MNGVKLFGNLRFCPPLSTSILLSILLRLVEEVQGADSATYSDNRFQMTEEQRLLYYLLKNYERAVRPVRNASDPIVVKLGLTLTNIFDMDEKNQVLTTNVWLDQEWNDELLRWDPVEFNGIQSIRIPCDLIWLPDIVLYNNADDYAADYMRARAMVHFDGTIFWPPPTQLRSTCKIDVTYFPFDSQHCFLKFGSWTYHGFQVDVTNRSPNVDLTNYVVSGEFDLVNVQQRRRIVQYTCCPEPYPDVTFFIHVRRKTLYYMYNVVFPCMMMSALTLLVFCLPPDSGEKIALGITVLLAFSVFVLAIAEKMPETSDSMPLIGIYLTVVMGMTSVSVVMTVMVLNFHHRGPFHKQLPDWLRWLVLNKLRRLLCMKMPYETAAFVSSRQSSTARRMSLKITIDKLRDEVVRDVSRGGVVRDEPSVPIRRYGATDHSVGYDQQRAKGYCNTSMDVDQESTSSCACRQKSDLQREVVKTLLMLISRQELEEECETLANEWRQVAQIVDRLFFWLFLTATVTITVVLLIVIPLVRHAHELEGVKNPTRDETPSTLIAHVNSSTFNWTLFE